ncbi:MAG: hypothetical protein AB1Z18_16240, partial [Desulfobacterales bacterium]
MVTKRTGCHRRALSLHVRDAVRATHPIPEGEKEETMNVKVQKTMFLCVAVTVMLAVAAAPAMADMAAAKKWVDQEFQPSTLTKQEQLKEMEWFINAAKPFKGMNIKVVSETIATHEY